MNQPTTHNSDSKTSRLAETLLSLRGGESCDSQVNADSESTTISLESLQQNLELIMRSDDSKSEVLRQFVMITGIMTRAVWCGLVKRSSDQTVACVSEYNGVEGQNLGLSKSSVLPTAQAAITSAKSRISTSGNLTVIATPVFGSRENAEAMDQCLCLALNLHHSSAEPFVMVLQLVATYVARWYERETSQRLDWQVDATAAIAELMAEISACEGLQHSAVLATNRLGRFLGASTVAIGFCRQAGSKRIRIASISGATEVDRAGERTRQIESALNETLVRNSITTLPDVSDDRTMKLAHQQLIKSHPGSHLVSASLITSDGETIGAWLFAFPLGDSQDRMIRFAEVAGEYLATALDVSSRAAAGPFARLKRLAINWSQRNVGRILLVAMLVLVLVMAIPLPHRINCDCVTRPELRRFAVAPHSGILLELFVKPGDIVSAGQTVARMDDRELKLELAELIAQRETVKKERDVNRSARNAAATKISEYEIEKLDAKIALIQYRLENLEIESDIDGVVLRCDLEDARGAPVQRGDVLAEISPLTHLKMEVDIHEKDVGYVKVGQSVTIVLDGSSSKRITESIGSIHPMSEIRNGENVFVAEMSIANDDQRLRPGMHGRAKIREGLRPIGWILFHRPIQKLSSLIR